MLTVGVAALALVVGTAATALVCRRTAARTGWLARLLHPTAGSAAVATSAAEDSNKEAPATGERIPAKMEPETVEALLEQARALADNEQARGASLKQRAGFLLGFLGVMLTVLLTQAREFARSDLGAVGEPVAAALVLVALVLILDAARWAIKTLATVSIWHVDVDEANRYPTWAYISKAPEIARGEMLRGWARQFADERPANDTKATQLQRAFARLTAGIAVLAGVALIVSLRTLGV